MFGHGMKVLTFSSVDNAVNKSGWVCGGENIKYTRNEYKKQENQEQAGAPEQEEELGEEKEESV